MQHQITVYLTSRQSLPYCNLKSIWASMILNDEVASNAIVKRATKHYTVVINTKPADKDWPLAPPGGRWQTYQRPLTGANCTQSHTLHIFYYSLRQYATLLL